MRFEGTAHVPTAFPMPPQQKTRFSILPARDLYAERTASDATFTASVSEYAGTAAVRLGFEVFALDVVDTSGARAPVSARFFAAEARFREMATSALPHSNFKTN